VPQRFNSALGLAPHVHSLVSDGVWVREPSAAVPTFRALPAPTQAEIAAVAWATCAGTTKALRQRGLWLDADPSEDRFAVDEPFLATVAQASIAGLLCMGPNAGQRPMRLFGRAARRDEERADKGPKNGYGFDVHAGTRAAAKDKKARERLCRYLLRPPLSNDRLRRSADGRYEITLKRPWDDGTTAIVVSGQELLARLSALVPPPRIHTIRYYGVWASRSAWRSFVLPDGANDTDAGSHAGNCDRPACASHHRYRLSWAQALAKVFEVDVSSCPRCGQKGVQQIAVITDEQVLRPMVAAIDRKGEPP
jgi:hypothetical protein